MQQHENASQAARLVAVSLLTILVAGDVSAQDVTKCRATIAKEAAKYETTLMKTLGKCEDGLFKAGASRLGVCVDSDNAGEDCEADSQCPEGSCNTPCPATQLEAARAKMVDKIVGTCEGLTFIDMGFLGSADDCLERCAVSLSGASSVANCVACIGEGGVNSLLDATYSALLPTGDKDVLKCQQTITKTAGKHFATVRKSLQKCQDGVLKGQASSCPDAAAASKITGSASKLADGIAKKCTDALIVAGADPDGAGTAAGVNADCVDISDQSDIVALASGISECLNRTQAACTDAFAVGEPLTCNPGAICGNGRIDAGETCDDSNASDDTGTGPADSCPASCRIEPCTAVGTRNVAVNFSASGAVTGMTVLLKYDSAKVSIPGKASAVAVQNRVTSNAFAMTPNDLDYSLRNVVIDPTFAGVAPGIAFTVQFDTCEGSDAPSSSDFSCEVVQASDVNLQSISAQCAATVQ